MLFDDIKPRLKIYPSVYKPLEDSRILGRAVEKYSFGKMLDLGCGSGIQGIIAAKMGCDVTFADLNPHAVECASENAKINGIKGKFIVSSVFSNIKGKFNTISFDPPYLKSKPIITGRTNPSTDGGARGREVIDIFLDSYKKHVMKDHTVIMVESYWNDFKRDIKRLDAKVVERLHYPLLGDFVVLKFE
jgi:release factor glutamine methyltransferase